MDSADINLSTQSRQYGMPSKPQPSKSSDPPPSTNGPLQIPRPTAELPPKVPKVPFKRNAPNSHSWAVDNYSIVDDLAQSPAAM